MPHSISDDLIFHKDEWTLVTVAIDQTAMKLRLQINDQYGYEEGTETVFVRYRSKL